MLVAAHALEALLLLAGPLVLGRALCRRWNLPLGIVGVGLLTFIAGQVAQMAIAKLTTALFSAGMLPAPSEASVVGVGAMLAGLAAALSDEPLRWMAFRRYLPDHIDTRGGLLHGVGHGAGATILSGAMVLWMAGLAIAFEGSTFEELEQAGFEGRSAVRMGIKIMAWWEGDVGSVAISTARELSVLLMHIGLSAAVVRSMQLRSKDGGGRAWFIAAFVIHAIAATGIAWSVEANEGLGPIVVAYAFAGVCGLGLTLAAGRSMRAEAL